MAAAINILPGKLNRPTLGVKTLVRTRLYQQIDQSLKTSVTTIVAPAGFGKTVLLAGALCTKPEGPRRRADAGRHQSNGD